MVRSAAKNHARVTVVCDPADYDARARGRSTGGERPGASFAPSSRPRRSPTPPPTTRRSAAYLSARRSRSALPAVPHASLRARVRASLRREPAPGGRLLPRPRRASRGRSRAPRASGRAARSSASTTSSTSTPRSTPCASSIAPAAVVVKHTNPCGVAVADDARRRPTGRRARPTRSSAFGGIVALNRAVDAATAKALAETFLECVVAPSFAARGPRDPAGQEEPAPPGDGRMARRGATRRSSTSASAAGSSCRTATRRRPER